jgi:hypothetical protein
MKDDPPVSEEYKRFTALVDKVLSVPRSEMERRLAEYKKKSAENPNRRGPKRKVVKNDDAQAS